MDLRKLKTLIDLGSESNISELEITEADGKRQAWISLRAEGKLLKLFEGDEFQIGEVTVKLTRIAEKAVELDAAVLEKRLQVTLGQNLAEGRDLTAAGT